MSLAYCLTQNSSQGPQPLLTRSWVPVEASRILLIMRAVYPAETTVLLLEFPFAAGPSHRVESAQLNAVTSRNVICDAFVGSPVCEPRS
jgi:hypothetical protein